jgi:hypothetical protein
MSTKHIDTQRNLIFLGLRLFKFSFISLKFYLYIYMSSNSIEFKKKYLKYKNKYIALKDQLSFIQGTQIKQIGGLHDKLIFPRNIPKVLENTTYTNYVNNLQFYLAENPGLSNLWMMIGATNTDDDSDLSRFQREYDITITGYSLININEPNLLSLYSHDNDIRESLPVAEHNLYNSLGYRHVYDLLVRYLPHKFSKIIYDWATTKFILTNDKIFRELEVIKNLIALNGELYIDTFRESMSSILYLKTTDGVNYYLKDFTWDPITRTRSPEFNVTPDILERYVGYNKGYNIRLFQAGTPVINHPETLFRRMRPDGSIPKVEIDSHIRDSDYHALIKATGHDAETMRRLNIIFPPAQFTIRYIQNAEYPNNSNMEAKCINNFYLITRIA